MSISVGPHVRHVCATGDWTVVNAGRSYRVNTVIEDLNFVPSGQPDAGASTLKRIRLSVTPATATTAFETVTIYTIRSTQVTGTY